MCTVSRTIRGERYVKASTARKVRRACARMGYRPNLPARSLRTRRSHDFAVIAWSRDELHLAKLVAMERVFRDAGYPVTVHFGQPDGAKGSSELLDYICCRRPLAVALLPGPRQAVDMAIRELRGRDIPFVFLDPYPIRISGPSVDRVEIDRQQGVYEAVMHLAQRGYKRLMYMGPADETRLAGYKSAMAALGREPLCLELPHELDRYMTGRNATPRFLALRPRPDSVQLFSDEMALGFIAGLKEAGLRIPEDVAVVGFDNRRVATLCWPQLTTVAQPNDDAGQYAAETLLQKASGAAPPPGGWSRVFPTRLLIRQST